MINAEILKKIKTGAKVRVWEKIKEGDKERLSAFEGLVISRKHGNESGGTFIVRAVLQEVGVEKVFPINAMTISKVEILSSPKKSIAPSSISSASSPARRLGRSLKFN